MKLDTFRITEILNEEGKIRLKRFYGSGPKKGRIKQTWLISLSDIDDLKKTIDSFIEFRDRNNLIETLEFPIM